MPSGSALPVADEPVGPVLHALADPTRRAVVSRLAIGPASTGALAEPFGMALPSFTQHMAILEKAGLVTSQKVGRVRTYSLDVAALTQANAWIQEQVEVWNSRLDRMQAFVESGDR